LIFRFSGNEALVLELNCSSFKKLRLSQVVAVFSSQVEMPTPPQLPPEDAMQLANDGNTNDADICVYHATAPAPDPHPPHPALKAYYPTRLQMNRNAVSRTLSTMAASPQIQELDCCELEHVIGFAGTHKASI
jgi:hypothetical protein